MVSVLSRFESLSPRMSVSCVFSGNGVVDFTELASGLSVLCGGSRDDKVRAAFDLYDLNGDGFISLDEVRNARGRGFRGGGTTSCERPRPGPRMTCVRTIARALR